MSINENTINVMLCLQEVKNQKYGIGRLVGVEYEQQPGKWDSTKNEVVPLFSGMGYGTANATDYFDKYWSGEQIPENYVNDVTKNGLLTIPNFRPYGFESNNVTSTQCKDFSCSEKWSIYTKFLKSKCSNSNNNVALLVTHHNRMRDSNLMQGLLPFKDDSPYNAYANNFCLKISINSGNISYSLFYKGFPDKGDFKDCISINPTRNDNTAGSVIGGGSYKYFCNEHVEKFIQTDLINKGIIKAGINEINLDIYVIRHGNALHNAPVNISDFATVNQNRLDSSLTPLGMYQAKILGNYFMNTDVLNNANIILCCSFLQRTQLTGLLLLYYAGINLGSEMSNGMINMLDQAIIRYSKAQENGFDPTKFLGYSPLGEIIKDKKSKIYQSFEGEGTNFIDYLSELNKLLINNDSTRAIKILKDNLEKNSRFQTSDGWNRISGDDDDDDDDDNDNAPRFIPNQGGKKRRQTKKQRVMKSKKVRRAKKHNKKSKKVKRRSNKHKA